MKLAARPALLALAALAALAALPAPAGAEAAEAAPAARGAPQPSQPPQPPEESLSRSTLRRDVSGASYYELLAWCRELGLEDTGDRNALQARLLRHFGISQREPGPEEEVKVEILSARETEYFTIEQVDEDYVVLRGRVAVKVRDRDRDSVHTVEADSLVYNQTTKRMTATGGARYVLTKGGKDEVFEGESLSFDTETLEAIFYDGSVKRERTIGGSTLPFTFRGSSISRLSNETIILDDGTITSSTAADPYYAVHARRAWILGGGEWAVLGAALRVGRVPLFYLPFFFFPGDEILFHPTLEVLPREGTAIQTSTYLVGQRKVQNDPLSLLQIAEEAGAGSRRVRRGLFLTVDSSAGEPAANPDHALVLMADLYSRLGAMVGLRASFAPAFTGRIALGLSRTIVYDDTDVLDGDGHRVGTVGWTAYRWNEESGDYESVWNRSSFLLPDLPFRFGVDSTARLQKGLLGVNLSVEAYSDPYFVQDFYDRKESMDWNQLISGAAAASAATTANVKSSLTEKVSASINLSSLVGSRLLSELAVRSVEANAFFASRANAALARDEWAQADPARTFYYLASAKAPAITLGLRGTLLSLPGRSTSAPAKASTRTEQSAPEAENPGKGIRLPWEEEPAGAAPKDDDAAPEARAEAGIVEPVARPDAPVSLPAAAGSSLEVTYALTPIASVAYAFASSGWDSPDDVDYASALASVALSAQSDARLAATASLFARLLTVTNELAATGSYWTRAEGNAGVDLESERETDRRNTKLALSDKATLSVQPFLGVDALRSSSFSYSFGWQFLGIAWDAESGRHVTTAWQLDETTVSVHSLVAALAWKPELGSQTLTLTASLPPEAVSLRAQAQLGLWKLSVRGGLGAQQPSDSPGEWTRDPLTLGATFQPWSWLTATWDFAYDTENGWPTRMSTNLKLEGLTAALTQSRRTEDSVEQFLPALLQLTYALPTQRLYLWRDRVKLEAGLRSAWTYNFARPTQSEFTFNLNTSVSVHKFLSLSFASQSYNNRTYLYLPSSVTRLPYPWVNPVTDLLRSLNFFNLSDRYRSAFKVRSLTISVVHQLVDWDLTVSYTGKPELKTLGDGTRQYQWDRSLSFLLQWKPLQLIRAKATNTTAGGFTYGG